VKRRRLLYNKKADISITILVLGVFIICTLTLLNFYISAIKDRGFFEGILLVSKINELAEDIRFYDNLSKDSLELTGLSQGFTEGSFIFNGKSDGKVYFLEGTFNESYWFGFLGEKRLIHVEYKFQK
jgi:hypothetical protein